MEAHAPDACGGCRLWKAKIIRIDALTGTANGTRTLAVDILGQRATPAVTIR